VGLETIAEKYYAAVSEVASQLGKPAPDYAAILQKLEASRASIVIARNGIVGNALAFQDKFQVGNSEQILNTERLNRLAYKFGESIFRYFFEGEEAFVGGGTILSGLISSLEFLSNPSGKDMGRYLRPVTLELARSEVKAASGTLEKRWIEVSKAYADLKLFCES
jgi:hypothetical protein